LGRRVIALAIAYAIVLSGLFVNLGAAHEALGAPFDPWSVICHSPAADHSSPGQEGNSKTCVNGCCVGCLMLQATAPPPPATAVPLAKASGEVLTPHAFAAVTVRPQRNSHPSRAPPLQA